MATCHPNLPHHCKGLCKKCYSSKKHLERMKNPEYRKKQQVRAKKWAIDNPERTRELDVIKNLRKKYGITLEDYNELLKKQNGGCALCGKPESIVLREGYRKSNLAVDHCHTTGKVRGLLCFRHNTMLGLLNDDIELLNNITKYLGGTLK